MTDVIPFRFEGEAVRVVQVDGEPWFVAKDVAARLGYFDTADAIKSHCRVAKPLKTLTHGESPEANEINGLPGNALLIPERDIYRLVMRSRLPSAERFEAWVVGEVLPSIRKTGAYVAPVTDPLLATLSVVSEMRTEQIAHAARLSLVENEQKKLTAANPFMTTHCSVMAFAVENGAQHVVAYSAGLAARLGKAAAALSADRGEKILTIPDARWGRVNAYHRDVLSAIFADITARRDTQ